MWRKFFDFNDDDDDDDDDDNLCSVKIMCVAMNYDSITHYDTIYCCGKKFEMKCDTYVMTL